MVFCRLRVVSCCAVFTLVLAAQGRAQDPVPATPVQQTTADDEADRPFPEPGERFRTYLWRAYGVRSVVPPLLRATWDQILDNPEEWDQDAGGFGRRFASSWGRGVITETTRYGVSEALRLDTRYQRCRCDGVMPRVRHALRETFTARTRSGRKVVSVPNLAGPYAAGMIGLLWLPDRYDWHDGVLAGTGGVGLQIGTNILREFAIRK